MRFSLLLFVVLLQGCVHSDPWTKTDTILYSAVVVALTADAITTSRIQYIPGIYEAGPVARHVLGSQPSTSDTIMYFGTIAISNYFIGRALPSKWRRFWYVWETGIHTAAVLNNCKLGLC